MQQRHLFIMDPLEKLNFKLDTSLGIARELTILGHKCFFTTLEGLSWSSLERSPLASASPIQFAHADIGSVDLGEPIDHLLESFAGIHMRKEPPFDKRYIACTWFLDAVGENTKVVNRPSTLRDFNEKLGILQYTDAIAPALASSNPALLYQFIEQHCDGDGIVKPLDLYGGKGIFRVQLAELSREQTLTKLTNACGDEHQVLLAQAFNQKIFEGELRVFTLGGKALSWCQKIPSEGQFLANTSSGASLKAYQPSQGEIDLVEKVAEDLYRRGVGIAGLDIIGGAISEINITSPRLLQAPEDSHPYLAEIASWLECYCQSTI